MKNRLLLSVIMTFLLSWTLSAQDLYDKILLTVATDAVPAGEFIRMFRKSFDPGNPEELDKYLDQFVNFKLKVADAVAEGYDTTNAFKTELRGYRNQIAQNYLTDPESKEKLLKKAYQRMITEINAWHILIACPADASPEDTLKAWTKAIEVRERILQGEPFEQVAKSTSDDPSVKYNGGNLGYFSAFQMIMPFEDAAYNLKTGAISYPVRTPYGYHIIKVTGSRPSEGKIKVAHIMRSIPPGAPESVAEAARDTINLVYRKLLEGADFAAMAEKYSDHRESASNGGELNWFGAGEISSDFAEPALAIMHNGDFTKPVRTQYGWHIIKRIDKRPPGTFEESRSYLENRMNQSYLNSEGKKAFVEKLKKEYNYKLNQAAFRWFVSNTDTMIIKGLAHYDRKSMPGGAIYTYDSRSFSTSEFARDIETRGMMIDTRDPESFISQSIELSISDQIIKYEDSRLEEKYPDFRYLVKEFHDGILLFEISGDKVWNRSQNDTAGLINYYEMNKNKYLGSEGIEATVYSCLKEDKKKSFVSSFNRFRRFKDLDKRLYKKFNANGDTIINISKGTWYRGDDKEVDDIQWDKDVQEITFRGHPAIFVIERRIKPSPRPFNEVSGEIITGYQEYLENLWIEQLKDKYPVKIDNNVLEEVRKYLGNE